MSDFLLTVDLPEGTRQTYQKARCEEHAEQLLRHQLADRYTDEQIVIVDAKALN